MPRCINKTFVATDEHYFSKLQNRYGSKERKTANKAKKPSLFTKFLTHQADNSGEKKKKKKRSPQKNHSRSSSGSSKAILSIRQSRHSQERSLREVQGKSVH